MKGLWRTERELREQGFLRIAGVDEAGCGPIAGPVVAAAVIFSDNCRLPGLADSKLLKAEMREHLFALINRKALCVGVGIVEARLVDKINVLSAAHLAMHEAIAKLVPPPDLLLVDGRGLPGETKPQRAIIKGDRTCASIAAASIVAKVIRDGMMKELDAKYPQYGFGRHKGYGTKGHMEKLREHGPCPEHRRSFAPVRMVLQGELLVQGLD